MPDIFRRVEKKYIITSNQYLKVRDRIKKYTVEDQYGKSTICNIYFDNNNYDLIRHSIEKPIYKDKIRIRSYNTPTLNTNVYLEVKKKYDGVVGKRRIEMKLSEFYEYMKNIEISNIQNQQIYRELRYYFQYMNLMPKMYISYERRAFYEKEDNNFRITFDNNILAREYELRLEKGSYGENILPINNYIMEIKTLGAMPMWCVKMLDELEIAPCGFSKYGEGYTQLILNTNNKEKLVI